MGRVPAPEGLITHRVSPETFDASHVDIEGDAYRHLFRARRLAVGARIHVVDGEGRARWGEVESVDRRRATLRLGESAPSHESDLSVELWVGALRKERASWLVEKATELGVTSIHFFASERTPRNYGDGHLGRLGRVAVAAVEQCHRARVPEITGVDPWSTLGEHLTHSADGTVRLVLDASGLAIGPWLRQRSLPEAPVVQLVVGPEGGLTPSELQQLADLGVESVHLGRRTLRVETAAIAALAALTTAH